MTISSRRKARQPVKLSYSSEIAFVLLYELKKDLTSLHHKHCNGDDIDRKGVYDEDDKYDYYGICCMFVYFKLHFHNEGLHCCKNYFDMLFF